MEEKNLQQQAKNYTEKNIIHLSDMEHVRLRPGMYIGKLGDGSHSDDGIYVLIKEVIDNAIDEFRMGFGKTIEVDVQNGKVRVRDFGRGIPLNAMKDAVSRLNTGAKYDSETFVMSVGMNGVGTKAVNALSWKFTVQAIRENKTRRIDFKQGQMTADTGIIDSTEKQGTIVEFEPDNTKFENYAFRNEYITPLLRNYCYLNPGLAIIFNGEKFQSKNGLLDLLNDKLTSETLYDPIHIKGNNIEIVLTHTDQNNDEYYSFVNGQHTTHGGTHQAAYREAIGRTIKEFFNKNHDLNDIRNGVVGAIAVNVEQPIFESQTKTKLGSIYMWPEEREKGREAGPTVNKFVNAFVKQELDNYLHKHGDVAEILLQKIQESERERKAIAGVAKMAREKAKKVNVHNPKLRDCRYHFNDQRVKDLEKNAMMEEASVFITEGLSASGSITKSRNVETQAVFSLRGKPLNSFGMSKEFVYKNEEFYLLQSALNIENGLDGLRYNKVIIATDADDDGMHIRLLMLTFFLHFFPDLVKKGHVYILDTPLFRVRKTTKKGKEDIYCYSEEERIKAIEKLQPNPEITRFKGLGEISPDEFKDFIGENIRLHQVQFNKGDIITELLEFYMGKNTQYRQEFIIDNLIVDEEMI